MSRFRNFRILSGPQSIQGFTLVEVMVSAALLGLVALGTSSLLVAMGQAAAGARGVTFSDLLLNNLRAHVISKQGFANTKSRSGALQSCTNPNTFAAGSCNTAAAAPYTTPYSPQDIDLYSELDVKVAGTIGTPVRYTRALSICGAASPDCLLEAYATFMPVCPICAACTTNCARAESIVFEITVRQSPGVNARGGRLKDVTTTVVVPMKDSSEMIFTSGASTWRAPKYVTTAAMVVIGGGAGGGYNDPDLLDTYDHDDNQPPPNYLGRPLMERQYSGGPGGSSGRLRREDSIAVTAESDYTVTVGAGGISEANGGNTSVIGPGVNLVAEGGLFTGACAVGAECNRGGNGTCTSIPAGYANCSYQGTPWVETYPAQAGRLEYFFNGALPLGEAGAPNGNNGGGGAGYGPFQPASADDSLNTAGSGFRGRFAGAGGGGNVAGSIGAGWVGVNPAGKGAGGYVRIRW